MCRRWVSKGFVFQGAACLVDVWDSIASKLMGVTLGGWSYLTVTQYVGHTDITVAQCWNQCAREGTHTSWKCQSPKGLVHTWEDRHIVHQALQRPSTQGTQLSIGCLHHVEVPWSCEGSAQRSTHTQCQSAGSWGIVAVAVGDLVNNSLHI